MIVVMTVTIVFGIGRRDGLDKTNATPVREAEKVES